MLLLILSEKKVTKSYIWSLQTIMKMDYIGSVYLKKIKCVGI